jgi:hypothetical protein
MLTAAQKANDWERAESTLQTLESHAASNFHFMWTGEGSWLLHECHHETMWAASCEEVDDFERPTHYHKKTMVSAFFNGSWVQGSAS